MSTTSRINQAYVTIVPNSESLKEVEEYISKSITESRISELHMRVVPSFSDSMEVFMVGQSDAGKPQVSPSKVTTSVKRRDTSEIDSIWEQKSSTIK